MGKLTGVYADHAVHVEAVHEVKREAQIHLHPADILGVTANSRQNSQMHALLRLPGERRAALHRPFEAAGDRHDRQHDVILGHHEIVHHRRVRRGDVCAFGQNALGVYLVHHHVRGESAGGHIGEENHLPGFRVYFRMGRHGSLQFAAKIPTADGFERVRVQFEGPVALLHHQQPPGVPHSGRIGETLFVGEHEITVLGIAVERVQGVDHRPAFPVFGAPLGRAHPAVAIIHLAVLDVKSMHHAVTGKQVVIAARCEALVGAGAIQRTVQRGWQFSLHHQVARVTLHLDWPKGKVEKRVCGGHRRGHAVSPADSFKKPSH